MIEYERVIYSFFDMVGDIGGFGEAVYIFCLILVSGYANRMFIASVIRDMFKVRLDTHGADIKELVQAKTDHRKRRSLFKRKTADEIMIAKMFSGENRNQA